MDDRTNDQIVADANRLARVFYDMLGYEVPEGYRFDKASHPQERSMWDFAMAAYELIQGTDAENALDVLKGGE